MSNGDDYAASQDDRSRRYNDAYKVWLGTLTDAQRAELKKQGLDRPDDGRFIPTPGSYDITEMQLGADESDDRGGVGANPFEFDEPVADSELPGDEPGDEKAVSEAPRHADRWREVGELLMILLDATDTRYVATVVALAAGCEGMLAGCTEREIAERWHVARPHVRGAVRAVADRLASVAPGGEPDWDFVVRTVTLIITQPSARLSAECFCLAADLGGFLAKDGEAVPSQADLARKHRCTRAAVSKRVKTFSERLGLRPCGGMRKLELCEKYREARHRRVELERTTLLLP